MVDHSLLLRKLSWYGVRSGELKWFEGYLEGRRQRVSLGDATSEWTDIRRGVPQLGVNSWSTTHHCVY